MARYAIIGTRKPDTDQVWCAERLAKVLSAKGHKIHTGGATGIDNKAMWATSRGRLRVFLPWDSYNAQSIPESALRVVFDPVIHLEWVKSVVLYHPYPSGLNAAVGYQLHARNYGILTYPEHVAAVFAFPNEQGEGGTGQGIRIAKDLNIPWILFTRSVKAMSRPRIKDCELTPLFIGYIDSTFFGNRKAAYKNLGMDAPEHNCSLEAFRSVIRGENNTETMVINVEQAAIAWAESHNDAKTRELKASATVRSHRG